ncbi:hypothetical protein [Actinophytocola gossypii]|uniref:DUF2567 domain-containing protein n=1 Tax=Actinophytocola gossypii TaxID=2812003 RepID=A0ABT2JHR5_9PSEU|nr:hypothetical protein [Actinophytocola gossypii]MCT2587283.1 hypothetical protein [Actinophytocola gossypii]
MHAMAGAGRLRGLAILGTVAAGLLVLVSTFVNVFTLELSVSGSNMEATVHLTNWGVETTVGSEIAPNLLLAPHTGYPLMFCAAVLLGAAIVSATARSSAATRVAGLLSAVGAAFLAGVVWSVVLMASRLSEMFDFLPPTDDRTVSTSAAPGLWLLGGAVGLALGAAVAAFLRGREEPVLPEADLATPPMGFAVQSPDQGEPVSQPVQDSPRPDVEVPEQPYVRHAVDVPPPPTGLAPLAGPATSGAEPSAGSESADRPNDGP